MNQNLRTNKLSGTWPRLPTLQAPQRTKRLRCCVTSPLPKRLMFTPLRFSSGKSTPENCPGATSLAPKWCIPSPSRTAARPFLQTAPRYSPRCTLRLAPHSWCVPLTLLAQKLAELMTKCWAPAPEARPAFQEVMVMIKEIQEELKSVASATEVPKEAGQSLSSRAPPPAAKPAPIIGACRQCMCAFECPLANVVASV